MSLPTGSAGHREQDGVSALFRTRAEVDLVIEHLTQEYGIDPAFIYAEPNGDENSVGTENSGGDHASGAPSHSDRPDAPLHGTIQLTVLFDHRNRPKVMNAIKDSRPLYIETF